MLRSFTWVRLYRSYFLEVLAPLALRMLRPGPHPMDSTEILETFR